MIATYRIDRRKENILHQMIGDSVNKIIMKSCSDKTNEICLITTLESGENETVDSMQSLQNENGNKINDISHPKNDVRDLNHSEDEEEKKDEDYQKDKEQRKDKDHSISKSETLDKLIQMVRDLDKRVVVIQNVLRVKVTSPTPTFNTPNFDTRFTSPTPTFTSPKFDLLSKESCHSGKCTNEVLMRDICKIPVFQPLMKIKKRLVQQDSQYIQAGLKLLKLRKINNPDLFLNKTALVVGVKFLEEIDELYDEFLGDKEGFQFGTGFDKYNIEKNINFLYSAIAVEEKYWVGVVVNLEKRSITAFNCAAMKFTDLSLVP
ncbi:hypothetical protein Bca52824_047986 [Brassica carinata]|uniref:Uncharacterized protein n=1 Tax=Brassica carinata TaxID=52824 RepID=A0A8X7RI43_BRACI|nr:hypothetical protein Bca52824_047986 [Brassica carinata]